MKKVSFVLNKKNLEYNLDKYADNNNILYITGLSGSGKTTIAKKLAKKYNATLFELDNLGGYFGEYKEDTSKIHTLTKEFLDKNVELKEIIKKGKYVDLKIRHFEQYAMWTNKYISFLEEYVKRNNNLYVFEGTQIFKCVDFNHYLNKPLIIVRTSSITSLIRRIKRQHRIDIEKNKSNFYKKHFWKLLNDSKRLHLKDTFYLNKFIKLYERLIKL